MVVLNQRFPLSSAVIHHALLARLNIQTIRPESTEPNSRIWRVRPTGSASNGPPVLYSCV